VPSREQIISENPGNFFVHSFCTRGIYIILFVVYLTMLSVVQTVMLNCRIINE
jgi:hypothetical protein